MKRKLLILFLLLLASPAFGQAVPSRQQAPVLLIHKTGRTNGYGYGASTDAARGTALLNAVAACAAGEEILMGPGIFDIAGNVASGPQVGIQMPVGGATLRGSGAGQTTIKSDHARCIVFTSNTTLSNFTLYGKEIDAAIPVSQSPLSDNGTAATGVVISNIICNGESDCFFPTGVGSSAQIYNSQFTNYFDNVRVTGAGSVYDFYNCKFTVTTQPLGGYATTRSISVGSSGTVRLFNCTSTNSNNSATRCCAANISNAGGTLEIHGGYFSATNAGGGTTADILNQSGNLSVMPNVEGSGTNGAIVTSGTITYPVGSSDSNFPKRAEIDFESCIAVQGTKANIIFDSGSNYRHFEYSSTHAQNDNFSNGVLLRAGTYSIDFYTYEDANRGVVSLLIDGASVGTVDCYNATPAFAILTLNNIAITSGYHKVEFKVATTNHTDYYMAFEKIIFHQATD